MSRTSRRFGRWASFGGAGRVVFALSLSLLWATPATAQDAANVGGVPADPKVLLDTIWVVLASFLVFWLQAGFALIEGGLTRAKNTNNIMMKNLMGFCLSTVAFWAVGFAVMFGNGLDSLGTRGWFLAGADNAPAVGAAYQGDYQALSGVGVPLSAKFLFHLMLAGAAVTIVSGAMAERTRFNAYLLYAIVASALIYPVVGRWVWGGGWLHRLGFRDFAGATVVHSTGAWLALIGAILVGPRLGKYTREGKAVPIPGHSPPMAVLGVFILWLGWFGFNAGPTMAADLSLGRIALATNLGAATGAIAAMVVSWLILGKADVSMTLNGVLAGLVAVGASCASISPTSAAMIGAAAGAAVVLAVLALDQAGVDDPVGAIAVHGVGGVLGTLFVGLFAERALAPPNTIGDGLFFGGGLSLLGAQLVGVVAVFVWSMLAGAILFGLLKLTVGLRVKPEEEVHGLDLGEHASSAYPDFAPALHARPEYSGLGTYLSTESSTSS